MMVVRPLTIAEIFDRAVTLVVRRWKPAAAIALILSIPQTIGTAMVGADAKPSPSQAVPYGLLQFAYAFGFTYAFAALVMLFTGPEGQRGALALYGAALRSFGRLFAVSLWIGLTLFGIAAVLAVVVVLGVLGGPVGIAIAGAIVVPVAVPLFFVLQVALANAVVEGSRGTAPIGAAFRRALAPGRRVRTLLLSFAAVTCYFAPTVGIAAAAEALSSLTGQRWITVAADPVEVLASVVFYSAVVGVAAVDYRMRSEGTDLEGALDAAPAP
jgi:hypothetical protein